MYVFYLHVQGSFLKMLKVPCAMPNIKLDLSVRKATGLSSLYNQSGPNFLFSLVINFRDIKND